MFVARNEMVFMQINHRTGLQHYYSTVLRAVPAGAQVFFRIGKPPCICSACLLGWLISYSLLNLLLLVGTSVPLPIHAVACRLHQCAVCTSHCTLLCAVSKLCSASSKSVQCRFRCAVCISQCAYCGVQGLQHAICNLIPISSPTPPMSLRTTIL